MFMELFFYLCHNSPNVLKFEEKESKTTCPDSEGEVSSLVYVYAPSVLSLRRRGWVCTPRTT